MKSRTEKTLQALLSGQHPEVKKYAGKQVFIVDDEVVTLKSGKNSLKDFTKLEKKHGKSPVVVFVPQPGATYILFLR